MNTLKSYGKERHELSARCDHKKCAQCAHNAAAVQASKIFMVWCFCSGLHSTLNTLLMITKHGELKPRAYKSLMLFLRSCYQKVRHYFLSY